MHREPLYRQFRRASIISAIVLAGIAVLIEVILYQTIFGLPLQVGVNFQVFWYGMREARDVGFDLLYDGARLTELYAASVGGFPKPVYAGASPIHYLIFGPLTHMPIGPAMLSFLALNLLCWYVAIRLVWPHLGWRNIMLAFPSTYVFFTLSFGQAGGILALLLVLVYLRRGARSGFWAAGIWIAPGFLGAIPLLWIARRDWRALICFLSVSVFLFAVSSWYFGADIWRSYVTGMPEYLEYLRLSERYSHLAAPLAAVMVFKLGSSAMILVHLLSISLAVWIFVRSWEKPEASIMLSGFLLATVLLNPTAAHYDMVVLTIAAIILMRALPIDQRPVWRFAILFFWIAPFFAERVFEVTGFLVYVFVLALLVLCQIIVLRQARH